MVVYYSIYIAGLHHRTTFANSQDGTIIDFAPPKNRVVQNFNLAGTWLLESWTEEDDRGIIIYPQGEFCSGFITFGYDEYTMVIYGAKRDIFKQMADRLSHDYHHRLNLFSAIISHTGYYRIINNQIAHMVVDSNHHMWQSSCRYTYYRVYGDRLKLSTPPFIKDGVRYISNQIWIKI